MGKKTLGSLVLALFTLVFVLVLSSVFAAEETLTITTYYPSPYGAYRELQTNILYFSGGLEKESTPCSREGGIIYDDSENKLYLCDGGGWRLIGDSLWTAIGNNAYYNQSGNVGIGTNNPGNYKLAVVGNQYLSGLLFGAAGGKGASLSDRDEGYPISFDWSHNKKWDGVADPGHDNFYIYIGDIPVVGFRVAWSGGLPQPHLLAKQFVIEHPVEASKYLVHACIEGPEAAVYYRGSAKLDEGEAEVRLPDYFESLTLKEGRTVTLTNIDGFDRIMVKRIKGETISDGRFIVASDNPSSIQEFDWEVKAIRRNVSEFKVEPEKSEVEVQGFGPYTYSISKQ